QALHEGMTTAGSAWRISSSPTVPVKGSLPSAVPPVLESPESSEEQMVAEGSDVTFTCEATGSPAPAVTWLKDGEPLGRHSDRVPGGPQLSLVAVGPADAGIYSCLVVNEAGEVSKAFHLLVMGPCHPLGFGKGSLANFLGAVRG
uniref:Ig-like domain-containing protein n=1 Tax=Malurus cyaneus samueli TaxID=2593467 RepID=A0A8C5UA99_9PASS